MFFTSVTPAPTTARAPTRRPWITVAPAPMKAPSSTVTSPHSVAPGAKCTLRPTMQSWSMPALVLTMLFSSIVQPGWMTAPAITWTPSDRTTPEAIQADGWTSAGKSYPRARHVEYSRSRKLPVASWPMPSTSATRSGGIRSSTLSSPSTSRFSQRVIPSEAKVGSQTPRIECPATFASAISTLAWPPAPSRTRGRAAVFIAR